MTESRIMCFYCQNDCQVDGFDICKNATHFWKGTLGASSGSERQLRGCFNEVEQTRNYCDSGPKRDYSELHVNSFCNIPISGSHMNQADKSAFDATLCGYWILIAMVTCTAIIISSIMIVWRKYYRLTTGHAYRLSRFQVATATNRNTVKDQRSPNISVLNTSVSGSSMVRLAVTPKLSHHTTLITDEDDFGPYELWHGKHNDKQVMVKIYKAKVQSLWEREIYVYTTLLRSKHDNILGYIGHDTTGPENDKRLWIVTNGHGHKSLSNYLKLTKLDQPLMLKAVSSLAKGLSYLHKLIPGRKGKPSMAHRNLSSKTVFVKNQGMCVIGGFEHLVTREWLSRNDFLLYATKRYMSPELLEPAFANEGNWSLETFQKSDIYNLGLILWEICSVCSEENMVIEGYRPPFFQWYEDDDRDPTAEEMREIILGTNERRPVIPEYWKELPTLKGLRSTIEKCWDKNPDNRPSIELVKRLIKETALDWIRDEDSM